MNSNKNVELTTWEEADNALAMAGKLQQRLTRLRTRADQRIDIVEARFEADSEPLLARLEAIRSEMELFFRKQSKGIRSKKLSSGRIGLRRSEKLVISKPATTMRRLAQRGMGDCIRIKHEIDKQALRRFDENTLQSLGVKRRDREVFFAIPRKDGK